MNYFTHLMNPSGGLRSTHCREKIYVRFVNNCTHPVDILWVNYVGVCVRFKTLKPKEFLDVNTYASHPWLSLDSKTADRMLICHWEVFFGDLLVSKIREMEVARGVVMRVVCVITAPLFDLKKLALRAVRNCIDNVADIKELELPRELKVDLVQMFLDKARTVTIEKDSAPYKIVDLDDVNE